jgi:hypothetical protein
MSSADGNGAHSQNSISLVLSEHGGYEVMEGDGRQGRFVYVL